MVLKSYPDCEGCLLGLWLLLLLVGWSFLFCGCSLTGHKLWLVEIGVYFRFLALFPFDAPDFVFSLMRCFLLYEGVLSFEGVGWNCF